MVKEQWKASAKLNHFVSRSVHQASPPKVKLAVLIDKQVCQLLTESQGSRGEASMKSHKTKNDLKSNAKAVSIDILNSRLAEAIDLALATKQAHWNIKGNSSPCMRCWIRSGPKLTPISTPWRSASCNLAEPPWARPNRGE